jgi:hypothetical protein
MAKASAAIVSDELLSEKSLWMRATMASKVSRSSSSRMRLAKIQCFRLWSATRALPSAVFGPLDAPP